MSRTVTLVLVDGAGALLGALPPYEVPTPWWQDASDVVVGAGERYGVEVTVLRLLATDLPAPHGGAVTYLVECPAGRPPQAVPLDPAEFDLAAHPLRALWARPGGPAASLAWAARELSELGWRPAATCQQRTWNLSAIWRLNSASGVAWLKQVPPMFAHEPAVLRWLAGVAPHRVPAVLAADNATGRMLLAHAPGEDCYFAPAAELADLIDDLHHIQSAVPAHIESLRAVGVPDKRWPVLARRIRDTVERHGAGVGDHVKAMLGSLVDGLEDRFSAIESCGLPDTLGHGDFHAGNARSDGNHRTLIDWGDSFIGHPGFDALRIVERQPPAAAARLRAYWANRWRAALPGCDPERALDLLTPVAALSAAANCADFLAAIEPTEHPYHAADIATLLRAAVTA